MNSIDDFANLRPDDEPVGDDHLERLWERVAGTADPPVTGEVRTRAIPQPVAGRVARHRTRLVASVAAVAAVAAGVIAVAMISDRADAPGTSFDSTRSTVARTIGTAPSTPVAVTTVPPSDDPFDPGDPPVMDVDGVDEPPLWGIAAQGWTRSEFRDEPTNPDVSIELIAGPDGVDTSWVAIASGVSDPFGSLAGTGAPLESLVGLGSVPDPGVPSADGDQAISSQRLVDDDGSHLVIAGGVSPHAAASVFRASSTGRELPDGFTPLPPDAGDAVDRHISYRFDDADGATVWVDVRAGGDPRFDVETAAGTATEVLDTPAGADRASIVDADGYTAIVRTGFWVSQIRTSAPVDDLDSFLDLYDELAVVSPAVWESARPGPGPFAPNGVALGSSVMLGAAAQLADAGFTVDATESRGFVDGLDVIRTLSERDQLPETLVVQFGDNGPIDSAQMDEFVGLVADVDTVVLLTTSIAHDGTEPNNALIFQAAADHDNIEVLDWAELSTLCVGECFYQDGFHLKPDGQDYYAALVVAVVEG